MLKWLLRIVALLLLVIVVAGVALIIYVDRVAATVLTEGVTTVGEVPCTVGGVNVSLFTGGVKIKDLVIMNPKGYPETEMFSLAGAEVETRIRSFWNQPVHIRKLRIDQPMIRIEAGEGISNVRVFLENVRRNAGEQAEAETDKAPTRLWVDELVIEGATVRFGAGVTAHKVMDIKLETVKLTKIRGRNDRGVTSGELSALIVIELVRRGVLAGNLNLRNVIPPDLLQGLDTILMIQDTLFKSTTNIFRAPLDALLGPKATKPAKKPE